MIEVSIIKYLYETLRKNKYNYLYLDLPDLKISLTLEKSLPIIERGINQNYTNYSKQIQQASQDNLEQHKSYEELKLTKSEDNHGIHTIVSTSVGVFNMKSTDIREGKKVSKNEILGIIKGLNTQEQVKSPVDGEIINIFIHNGEIADYGRLLFEIKESRKTSEEK